jgi:hypothetical protein
MPLASKAGADIYQPTIKAKTAAYAVTAAESGCWFTNRGATASVTFTLPAVTNLPIGTRYTFYGVSAYGFAVASEGSSDNIASLNDATADSITCTTASKIIGACVTVIWDGTAWLATQASVGNTYTVA